MSFIRSSFTNAQIEAKTWLPCVLMVLVGDLASAAFTFKRLMVLLHFPPSLVDRGHPLVIEGQVAANQIQNAFASVLVLEDLLAKEQRKAHFSQLRGVTQKPWTKTIVSGAVCSGASLTVMGAS